MLECYIHWILYNSTHDIDTHTQKHLVLVYIDKHILISCQGTF